MRARFGWVLVGLMACTSATTAEEPSKPAPEATPEPEPASEPAPEPEPESATPPADQATTVQMTAATLADDCGGGPKQAQKADSPKAKRSGSARMAKARRACQQTSMQLSVSAAADTPRAQLSVTKVELFDDKGALLGELTPRSPTVWGEDGTYTTWDEAITGGQELSVSYALTQPPWGDISDRRDRTYVLKAALSIDGDEQLVQREVEVAAPTILPPNVKT